MTACAMMKVYLGANPELNMRSSVGQLMTLPNSQTEAIRKQTQKPPALIRWIFCDSIVLYAFEFLGKRLLKRLKGLVIKVVCINTRRQKSTKKTKKVPLMVEL